MRPGAAGKEILQAGLFQRRRQILRDVCHDNFRSIALTGLTFQTGRSI